MHRFALMVTGLFATGCACATGDACFDEAQRHIAEGPTSASLSVATYSFDLAATFERGCALGHAPSCREALRFWTTRTPEYPLVASGAYDEALDVSIEPERINKHVQENLARLVSLEFASAKARNSRETWKGVAVEFPNTVAARLANEAEDKLIVASLGPSAPLSAYVAEVAAARPTVLAHIEQYAASLSLASVAVDDLVKFGSALAQRAPESPGARRLLEGADDASFAHAKDLGTADALRTYLATYGAQPMAGREHALKVPETRVFLAPIADDYAIEAEGHGDIDLSVTVDGNRVCNETSSASREHCELKGVAKGANVEVRVVGAQGEALLRILPKHGTPAAEANRGRGRHVDEALTLLEAAVLRAMAAQADKRNALYQVEQYLASHKGALRDESYARRVQGALVDAVRGLDADAAMKSDRPDDSFAFFRKYPNAQETAAVRARLAVRLAEQTGTVPNTDAYDRFLELFPGAPEAKSVTTSLNTVKTRLAAEEAAAKRQEALEAFQAAQQAAQEKRACIAACATEALQCNSSCSGLTVGQTDCLRSCRWEHISCEQRCR